MHGNWSEFVVTLRQILFFRMDAVTSSSFELSTGLISEKKNVSKSNGIFAALKNQSTITNHLKFNKKKNQWNTAIFSFYLLWTLLVQSRQVQGRLHHQESGYIWFASIVSHSKIQIKWLIFITVGVFFFFGLQRIMSLRTKIARTHLLDACSRVNSSWCLRGPQCDTPWNKRTNEEKKQQILVILLSFSN